MTFGPRPDFTQNRYETTIRNDNTGNKKSRHEAPIRTLTNSGVPKVHRRWRQPPREMSKCSSTEKKSTLPRMLCWGLCIIFWRSMSSSRNGYWTPLWKTGLVSKHWKTSTGQPEQQTKLGFVVMAERRREVIPKYPFGKGTVRPNLLKVTLQIMSFFQKPIVR